MSAKTAKILITIDEASRKIVTGRVRELLRRAGAINPVILKDAPHGVLQAWVPGDPRPIVRTLQRLFEQDPVAFSATHRWVPVESWTRADPRDLTAYAQLFQRSLSSDESWKIDVHKHSTDLSSHELIDNIAALIDRPNVKLEDPDRTLLVSVLGHRLGFADLRRGEVFDTHEAALVAKDKPGPWAPKD